MKVEEKRKEKRSRSRSSMGCLTCRRKRKKCDEKLYPTCLRCQEKHLPCEWPLKVQQIQQQLGHVRYIGNEEIGTKHEKSTSTEPSLTTNVNHITETDSMSNKYTTNTNVSKDDGFNINEMVNFEYNIGKTNNSTGLDLNMRPFTLDDTPILDSPESRASLDTCISVPPAEEHRDVNEQTKKKSFLERIALQQDCVDDL